MSLRPHRVPPIPEETARVARLAFRRGNPYLVMREQFEVLFQDKQFRSLFSSRGRPALAPWRVALVTLLQFAEGLSDRQAADALRARIDWKYLLCLELSDPGFDYSILCEFRARLVAGSSEALLFEILLNRFREQGLLKARGKQRTDATHVLAAIRVLNRLEMVGETLRHALNAVAEVAPDWLREWVPPAWFERYGRRFEDYRLPQKEAQREVLATTIGADGFRLLSAIYEGDAAQELRQVPAVETLRQVWLQQYYREAGGVRWRTPEELPPTPLRIVSPHDPAARCGRKRAMGWTGYKQHVTETCDPERPVLITDVQTTPACAGDNDTLPEIQAALEGRALLPGQQLVDGAYVEAKALVQSQERYQVDLVGPAPKDTAWQARAGAGFAASDFRVNWEEGYAVCPEGKRSVSWEAKPERGEFVVQARFAHEECKACPSRSQCTRAVDRSRRLTLRPQREYEALQAARQREGTAEFRDTYRARAGVEGTHSQAVRVCDVRHSRYTGFPKVRLQHLLTAAALNFIRVADWLMAKPQMRTRRTAFLRLLPNPA